MTICFDSFVEWCEHRFDGEIIVKGNEVKINSIFTDDNGHHLWCSPKGGKHNRNHGCYRCFKSEKIGTLIGLVMLVDSCSYDEARDILSGQTPIGLLEDKLEEFFKEKEQESPKEIKLKLPEGTFPITELPKTSLLRMEAEDYLAKRKISADDFCVCGSGDYKNRIIIPYYDANSKLIYFNGRSISPKSKLRYFGPSKEVGVGKGDVLYTPRWPKVGSKIYLTEGEFDAYTLYACGFNGMACGGKELTDQQINFIRQYKVCLALDEDIAGLSGLKRMGDKLISNSMEVTYVRPPKGIKDWNKMLVMFKPEIIQAYIEKNEKRFDEFTNLEI
jgi:DNA primase